MNVITVAPSFIGLTACCPRYNERIGSPTLAEAVIYLSQCLDGIAHTHIYDRTAPLATVYLHIPWYQPFPASQHCGTRI